MKSLLLGLLVAANLLAGLPAYLTLRTQDAASAVVTSDVAAKIGKLNGSMAARKPHVPFMTGTTWHPLANANCLQEAAAAHADYFLITQIELNLRPELQSYVASRAFPSPWTLVKSDRDFLLLANPRP